MEIYIRNYPSQMKYWGIGNFLNKSTRLQRTWSKMHQIKKQTPLTFLVLQLWASYPGWFLHFKCIKNAPCLWFGRFRSREKRCMHACLHRFTRELKRPNQRQGAFLRHLKCPNQNGSEAQSCSTKKVGFSKWCRFFDSMIFRPWPLPSGGF